MRRALFVSCVVVACASSGALAAQRWTESFRQGVGEFMIRGEGGARFFISCPSGLEKTNPGFSFSSKKLKIETGRTRTLDVQLRVDRASHSYKSECSENQCEWTSTDPGAQAQLEQSIARLRTAKTFVVRIPELGVSEQFSTSGAKKALENALEGCES